MIVRKGWAAGAAVLALALMSAAALAADFPAPKEGAWTARDFKFHTGEVMPELKLAYTTVGEPTGEPVLVLHGTTGSAASMLGPTFGGELFGKGQPLDATQVLHHPPGRGRPRQIDRNPPTACAPSSRNTTTTTWSRPTTASSRKASASAICAW